MKKITLIMMVMAFIAISCGSSKKVESVTHVEQQENSYDNEKITRLYDLKDFTGIHSDISVEVLYKQDNKYMVKVTGRRKDIERTDISVDKNKVLCFSRKKKIKKIDNSEKLSVEVSCPRLESVSNNGRMDMTAESITGGDARVMNAGRGNFKITAIKSGSLSIINGGIMELSSDETNTGKLHIYNGGRGDFKIGTVKSGNSTIDNNGIMELSSKRMNADKLDLGNGGRSDIHVDDMKTGGFVLSNNGIMNMKSGMIDCSSLDIKQGGRFDMKADLKSDNVNVYNSGIIEMKSNITGGMMSMNQQGRCDANIVFKGSKMDINNSGIGNVDVNLDCDELVVNNGGRADLNISGTADKTSINGSGITNTNTKNLNNF